MYDSLSQLVHSITLDPSRYTGKERDTESGLDYFGARYYASSMGRFMSPDWSAKAEPVPYSKLTDPQSLNLYGYVGNNPLSKADADGHCWPFCEFIQPIINHVSSFLARHEAVGEAASEVGKSSSVTVRGGLGGALPHLPKGTHIEANATVYAKSGEGGFGTGIDIKGAARVGSVGGEVTINAPAVKDGSFVNPLKAGGVDATGNLTGAGEKSAGSGSFGRSETSIGGTYGEGLVVGGEVAASNNSLGNFARTLGDAIATDIKDTIDSGLAAVKFAEQHQ